MPDNDLTVLPAAIANLINLRELDVSKNSKQHHRSRRRAALPHKRFTLLVLNGMTHGKEKKEQRDV